MDSGDIFMHILALLTLELQYVFETTVSDSGWQKTNRKHIFVCIELLYNIWYALGQEWFWLYCGRFRGAVIVSFYSWNESKYSS